MTFNDGKDIFIEYSVVFIHISPAGLVLELNFHVTPNEASRANLNVDKKIKLAAIMKRPILLPSSGF